MGYSLAWTAIRGKAEEDVLAAYGLRRTGEPGGLPTRRAPYAFARLEDGWTLVAAFPSRLLSDRFLDERDRAEPFLAALSSGAEVVAGFVEEHVMCCRTARWVNGERRWSVLHEAEQGLDHLQVDGTPPETFAAVVAAARERQDAEGDEVDFFFEVPGALAKELTGFKHDETDVDECEVLEPSRPSKSEASGGRSWLRRIFGG